MSMQARRYFSHDMCSAVLAVRDKLDSNTAIISYDKSQRGVEVIAAVEEAHQVKLFSTLAHHPQFISRSAAYGRENHIHVSLDCDRHSKRANFFKTGTGAQNAYINQTRLSNGNDSCTNQHQGKRLLWVGKVTANKTPELMPELTAKHDSAYSPTISKSNENSSK